MFIIVAKMRGQDLVTFRDPGTTSLKTSFQELMPLRMFTEHSHLGPRRSQIQILAQAKKKRRPNGCRFFLVAGAGFEPAT